MNSRKNFGPSIYQQLLEKLDEVTKKQKQSEKDFPTSPSSPTIYDLWRGLHPSSSSTFGCPHCPHCTSPLTPHFPQLPPAPLLTSLNSCQTHLQFINAIVWAKSLMTASPLVPITEVKRILKALVEIEEDTPPRLTSQVEVPRGSSTETRQPSLLPPTLTMILEVPPGAQESRKGSGEHEKPKESSSSRGNEHLKDSESSGNRAKNTIVLEKTDQEVSAGFQKPKGPGEHENPKKSSSSGQGKPQENSESSQSQVKRRKLEENDSAVVLSESPSRTWASDNRDLPQDYPRKTVIPDSDEEASQMTPDMSFGGSYEWNDSTKDSGLEGDAEPLPPGLEDVLQEVCEFVQEIEEEEDEAISSVELSGILQDLPVISVALSIVRNALRALEAEDSVEYCWREGGIVQRAVKEILGFIDTVAVEEYKYPGYLDFFVKCSVQTVVNVFERNAGESHVGVKRYHHLRTTLELCNCRPICEEIISYLFQSLSKLSDEDSTLEESPFIVSSQSKMCLILDTLYMTLEKYRSIMNSDPAQPSLDFFHVGIVKPAEKLLNSWEIHMNNFVTKNLEVCTWKVLFLENLFCNLKTQLKERNQI
ncbi:uncharacterized protein LOC107041540 [Diachasma alloeum]|uniref:uncharacterized protein LOC107041540 n=1 Tax=Diachasma alloeum TaxID=454923 RepID=UPI0007384D77|nr:uncharacterized protein LOC107041540 [Diachasma alloeum]